MVNRNLTSAKKAKNDEFYTQYADIEKEVQAYLEYNPDIFRGKVIFCNCDDPFESNFFRYFANNFESLGLKKLMATSYLPSPIAGTQLGLPGLADNLTPKIPKTKSSRNPENHGHAWKIIIDGVGDENDDGVTNLSDVKRKLELNIHGELTELKGDGDFRSDECIELLKQADFVITNPPISLFREYVAQLVEYNKRFLIIGNMNAVTYKEVFPLISANKMWLGPTISSGDRKFNVPNDYPLEAAKSGYDENGRAYIYVKGVRWFTNLDHGRRHEKLPLMTMADNLKYSKHKELRGKTAYDKYDNYDAIEVPFTDAIPSDYDGVMGVPISFLDKYNPEQFEIVAFRKGDDGKDLVYSFRQTDRQTDRIVVRPYFRMLIRHSQTPGSERRPTIC